MAGPLLVAGNVGTLGVAVALGAVLTLVSGISGGVFFGVGSLGARGRQEYSRYSSQPKIRAGQFHAAKLAPELQTRNR